MGILDINNHLTTAVNELKFAGWPCVSFEDIASMQCRWGSRSTSRCTMLPSLLKYIYAPIKALLVIASNHFPS